MPEPSQKRLLPGRSRDSYYYRKVRQKKSPRVFGGFSLLSKKSDRLGGNCFHCLFEDLLHYTDSFEIRVLAILSLAVKDLLAIQVGVIVMATWFPTDPNISAATQAACGK
jgi:hypothetical protein